MLSQVYGISCNSNLDASALTLQCLLSIYLGWLLHMQEDGAALLSGEKSPWTRRPSTGKAKSKGKAPKACASRTRKARDALTEHTDEELDETEFRKKVQSVFHLPIADAATSLGLGVTVLKKRCRRIDIPRWPHRKLASIEKLIASVEKVCSKLPLMPCVLAEPDAFMQCQMRYLSNIFSLLYVTSICAAVCWGQQLNISRHFDDMC
jgi:hypothetical protein